MFILEKCFGEKKKAICCRFQVAVPGRPRLHAFGMLLGLYRVFQQWFQIENQTIFGSDRPKAIFCEKVFKRPQLS